MSGLKQNILPGNLPRHIAVIMDGNGRWATQQGEERIFGHRNAIEAVRQCTEGCAELGIEYLTLYAFSTENWGRPQAEVNGLMELFVHTIRMEIDTLLKNKIRLHSIGHTAMLPESCQRELAEAKAMTAENTGLNLVLALNYSGRDELTRAMQTLATKAAQGQIAPDEIWPDVIADHLDTAGIPDPELLIRTSGEMRISNFLLWQLAYTEIFITPTLWPDFTKETLHEAILNYQQRERRFGKVTA